MSQTDYNDHYDATAAKGLCWNGDGNKQFVYYVLVEGKRMRIECLECLECKAAEGEIQDARDAPAA